MSSSSESIGLEARLQNLECRFTWDLDIEDTKKEELCRKLRNLLDQDLGQNDRASQACCNLAYIRYLQGESQEALSLLQKSVELRIDHYGEESDRHLIVSYGDMAWLYFKIGDYTQSNIYCEKLEAFKRKYPSISPTELHPEVYGEKGWTFQALLRSNQRSVEYFNKALQQQPNDKGWNTGCAIALYHYEVDSQVSSAEESQAIRQLRRAIELNPEDGLLMVLLALRLAFYKKHEEADDLVEKALVMNPDVPRVWNYLQRFFDYQEQGDRSIGLLKRALQKNSQSSFIHYQLARRYKKKKKFLSTGNFHGNGDQIKTMRQQCIYHLKEALQIENSFVYAMAELALLYAEEKDLARAKELLDEALEMSWEHESKLQFVHFNYGLFHYYDTKQEAQAVIHFTKGLKLYPKTYFWKECAKKLKHIAENQLKVNPKDATAHSLLGLVYKEEGNKRKAAECYEKALEIDKENQEYLSALHDLRRASTEYVRRGSMGLPCEFQGSHAH